MTSYAEISSRTTSARLPVPSGVLRVFAVALASTTGLGDAILGFCFISAPASTLARLGISSPADPMMIRFLGHFVVGVGLATLFPLLAAPEARRWPRLAAAFEITAMMRLLVAVFLGSAILSDLLEPAWWTIACSDLGFAFLLYAASPRIWELRPEASEAPTQCEVG